MALIKCKECGHEVSDKASACPNCGCPIEKINYCVECGQLFPDDMNECPNCGSPKEEVDFLMEDDPPKTNFWKWIALTVGIIVVSAGVLYALFGLNRNHTVVGDEGNEDKEVVQSDAYQIILYEDGSGDFLTPDGSRLCGIGHTSGRTEKMDIFLTEEIKLMGIRTKSIDVIDGRLYASYGDYLSYRSGRDEDDQKKGKDVTVKETDDMTIITFKLDDNDVQKSKAVKADLSAVAKDQYCIVIYPDKEGALYAPGKKRLCGLKKDIYQTTEYEVTFKKEVELYGKETMKLAVDKGNVYLHAMDVVYDRTGEPSRRVGTAKVSKQDGVTLIRFSGKIDPSMKSSQQNEYSSGGGMTGDGVKSSADMEVRKWLRGKWVRAVIDPTMVELVYYVWTFTMEGYNFTYGSEYTYNSSNTYYPYEVKGDIIYTSDGKPFLKIDRRNNCLINTDNTDEVYKKK